MTRTTQISGVVKEMLEKPFKLGGYGDSFDCLSDLLYFYEGLGLKLPHEHKGITRENYVEKWNNKQGLKEYWDFLLTLGAEVQKKYMLEGDLMIFKTEGFPCPCIYLGSGHGLITHPRTNCIVISLETIKAPLVSIRRLLP